jgi:predicted enzyme related to lactoylglutathione lyase
MDFNSILIGSDDPARLIEYYTRILGEPAMADEGYTGWQIGRGFVSVGAHSEVHGRNAAPGRLIWNIETADVPGDFARMKAAGAIVVAEPYELGDVPGTTETMWIATLADPDDNYFQLMSPFQP